MNKKIIITMLLTICTFMGAYGQTGNWIDFAATGSDVPNLQGNTYRINTAEQLAWVAKQINNAESPETFEGKTFFLDNDIDLSAHYWTPINEFKTAFHGNGKTIKGMKINLTSKSIGMKYSGLFEKLIGAEVTNLFLEKGQINAKSISTSAIGGLAGFINGSTVTNCSSNIDVNVANDNSEDITIVAGGLIGGALNSKIINSLSVGSVNIVSSGNVNIAGGLIGEVTYGTIIYNCVATGTVSAKEGSTINSAGGIIGISNNNMQASSFSYLYYSNVNATGVGKYENAETIQTTPLSAQQLKGREIMLELNRNAINYPQDQYTRLPCAWIQTTDHDYPVLYTRVDATKTWRMAGLLADVGPNGKDVKVNGNTYTVNTSEGLAWVGFISDSYFSDSKIVNQPSGSCFEGCIVNLASDISLNALTSGSTAYEIMEPDDFSNDWRAILKFNGTIDGKGHTVSNCSNTKSISYEGLIWDLEEKGVLNNINFSSQEPIISDPMTIGGVIAINRGTIMNVSVNGMTITKADGYTEEVNMGALVGENYGTVLNSSVTNCNFPDIEENDMVGALIGKQHTGKVINCFAANAKGESNVGQFIVNYEGGYLEKNFFETDNGQGETYGKNQIMAVADDNMASRAFAEVLTGNVLELQSAYPGLLGWTLISTDLKLRGGNYPSHASAAPVLTDIHDAAAFASVGPNGTDVETGGTKDNRPLYKVKTPLGLAWMSWIANAEITSAIDTVAPNQANFYYTSITLANDIDLATKLAPDNNWIPFTIESVVFDGNGHSVKNLTSTSGGLIDNVKYGTIKNIGVVDANINTDEERALEIGVLANFIYYTGLNNVFSTGNIRGTVAGGLVGSIDGQSTGIYNSYSTVNVYAHGSGDVAAGGIIGYIKSDSRKRIVISNCYASGSINAITNSTTANAYAGGIAGRTSSGGPDNTNISNCLAINPSITAKCGNVNGDTKYENIGRIDGAQWASFSNNYALESMTLTTGGGQVTPNIGANQKDGENWNIGDAFPFADQVSETVAKAYRPDGSYMPKLRMIEDINTPSYILESQLNNQPNVLISIEAVELSGDQNMDIWRGLDGVLYACIDNMDIFPFGGEIKGSTTGTITIGANMQTAQDMGTITFDNFTLYGGHLVVTDKASGVIIAGNLEINSNELRASNDASLVNKGTNTIISDGTTIVIASDNAIANSGKISIQNGARLAIGNSGTTAETLIGSLRSVSYTAINNGTISVVAVNANINVANGAFLADGTQIGIGASMNQGYYVSGVSVNNHPLSAPYRYTIDGIDATIRMTSAAISDAAQTFTVTLPGEKDNKITYMAPLKSGAYTVASGSDFTFQFTVADGYDSNSVVVYSNGDILTDFFRSGKTYVYAIRNVAKNHNVTLAGIPTGNETIDINSSIKAVGKELLIQSDKSETISVFDISGRMIRQFIAPAGESRYTLPEGIYIVVGENGVRVKISIS